MRILFLLLFSLTLNIAYAQTFKEYKIADTGCFVAFPNPPGEFEKSLSADSADIYTGSALYNGYEFGAIVVAYMEFLEGDTEDNEELLTIYMNYLKSTLAITGSAGYDRGQVMESYLYAAGVSDVWTDNEGNTWTVRGWADNYNLAVLYIVGPDEYPDREDRELFLNGFRFPK